MHTADQRAFPPFKTTAGCGDDSLRSARRNDVMEYIAAANLFLSLLDLLGVRFETLDDSKGKFKT